MTNIQWTKPVCQLDASGLYLGQTTAELDVYARDGSYLMPAGCIDAAPPAFITGKAAKWTGADWAYIDDYRGQTAYDTATGGPVQIMQAGSLSDGLTLSPRPTPHHKWDGKKWTEDKAAAEKAQIQELAAAKAAKLAELNTSAQAFVEQAAGLDKIPRFELDTWPLQAAEAKAWQADPAAATPVLDGIAAARGITPDKLKAAALKKTAAYEALSAHIAGQRQALQSRIEAAKTVAALDKVNIAFNVSPTP